ncbi:hypothetical protein Leryth_011539 [Lithospermum erythrorhizon]|nr:hypothetical protein Leryth_011539 [Lithospermum erythrorhizon]
MAIPPGPYSGTSTLALVARASAFTFGAAYGTIKLKFLRVMFFLATFYLFIYVFCTIFLE